MITELSRHVRWTTDRLRQIVRSTPNEFEDSLFMLELRLDCIRVADDICRCSSMMGEDQTAEL